jgi:hypothetical protein
MIRFKKLFSSFYRERFNDIGVFLSTVVAFSREAFGVFIGEDRGLDGEDGGRLIIFAGDEFHSLRLALLFVLNGCEDLRVDSGESILHYMS